MAKQSVHTRRQLPLTQALQAGCNREQRQGVLYFDISNPTESYRLCTANACTCWKHFFCSDSRFSEALGVACHKMCAHEQLGKPCFSDVFSRSSTFVAVVVVVVVVVVHHARARNSCFGVPGCGQDSSFYCSQDGHLNIVQQTEHPVNQLRRVNPHVGAASLYSSSLVPRSSPH